MLKRRMMIAFGVNFLACSPGSQFLALLESVVLWSTEISHKRFEPAEEANVVQKKRTPRVETGTRDVYDDDWLEGTSAKKSKKGGQQQNKPKKN